MKKILLSIGVVLTSLTLNAQAFVNGNLNAPMAQIGGTVGSYATTGWSGLNMSPETTAPYEGSGAAKLTTTIDAFINSELEWGNDTIPGFMIQAYRGPISNPGDLQLSFAYKFTKAGTDTAYIQAVILDTMGTGANDDKVLFFDFLELTSSVANWTVADFQMIQSNNTGTPNRLVMLAVSSTTGYFDDLRPTVGSTLWIDDVRLGYLGINESQLSDLSVYPNPATNVLNINSKEEVSLVNIMTTDGKVVATSTTNSIEIDMLNAGMYIYRVTTVSGNVSTGNFVKN